LPNFSNFFPKKEKMLTATTLTLESSNTINGGGAQASREYNYHIAFWGYTQEQVKRLFSRQQQKWICI